MDVDERSYRRLTVWQKSMDLVDAVYTLTGTMPDTEKFGLISQTQRAAVSIPANIAEGYGRTHKGDYLRHLSFARGSLMELETLLTIAVRNKRLDRKQTLPVWDLCQQVGKMLTTMINRMKSQDNNL